MKKPVLSIDGPAPKKAIQADRPPTEGFATIVDGHFKTEFDTIEAAERNIGSGAEVGLSIVRVVVAESEEPVDGWFELTAPHCG